MSEKQNVLIFPSATYPAIQIIKCLKNSPRFHIIAGASYPNHAELICDDTVNDLPNITDPTFWDTIKRFIQSRNIRYIIPTDETAAMLLKEREVDLSTTIVCSPYETTQLCRYKSKTYDRLKNEDYIPKIYDNNKIDTITNYPIFIKPDNSQGSRGALLIESEKQLRDIKDIQNFVISEYLPGEEYTVDCFTNKDGELLFCNPRIRTRLMNGITARGNDVELTDEFQDIIKAINSKIQFRGYWFAQLKRDTDGHLKLLEICTRFAGSFAISKGKGTNLPLLALCDFSGLDTEVIQNDYRVECDKTYIDRYKLDLTYNHIYIDYDDTITMNNGQAVNPYVIAFLYECKAKNIKISLITRHKDTFSESLEQSFSDLSLSSSLFDEIIELKWDQSKKDVIYNPKGSIFIDNSFKERKEIHEAYRIPVFDVVDMDCLFDGRF